MTFQLHALPMEPFEHLFSLSDDELITRGARRVASPLKQRAVEGRHSRCLAATDARAALRTGIHANMRS